jgi:hypothetical protein
MWIGGCAIALALLFLSFPSDTHAQTAQDPLTDVDREITPPVSTTPSLKLESNTYLVGIEDAHTRRVQEEIEFQPVLPLRLTDRVSLVSRPTIRLFDDKPYAGMDGSVSRAAGFGDLEIPVVLMPDLGPWLAAAGPTFVLPTATRDALGNAKWQAGPAAVLGRRSPDWLVALFAQQFWSYAGSGDRSVSELKVQYFLTRYLDDGWSVGMSPTIVVDWKASAGQQLTFPVGLGVGKTLRLPGGSVVKLGLQIQYMPVHPDDFGRVMNVQLSLTPVLPPFTRHPVFSSPAFPSN